MHCCYCDSTSVIKVNGFTYSGVEHFVCEKHLNDLTAKIIHDTNVAKRMVDAHGIESITDIVTIKPEILDELLQTKYKSTTN